MRPSESFQAACEDIRTALSLRARAEPISRAYAIEESREDTREGRHGDCPRGPQRADRTGKRCFVCEKPNCWSTRHTSEERQRAYEAFKKPRDSTDKDMSKIIQYVTEFEGLEPDTTEDYE